MDAVINNDERTVRTQEGETLKISGLLVEKPKQQEDAFYPLDSDMCRCIAFRGQTNRVLLVGGEAVLT